MANTAEVINFPVPDVAPKEPRVADLDDGQRGRNTTAIFVVMHSN